MNAKDYSLFLFVFLLIVMALAFLLGTGLACSNLIESWSCKKNGIGFVTCLVVLIILVGLAFSDLEVHTYDQK